MTRKKTKKMITVGIVIAIVVIVSLFGTLFAMKLLVPKSPDPYVAQDTSETSDSETTEPATETPESNTATDENETKLDPAQVSSITIDPLGIVVSYKKGIGPFSYEVLRTPNGTKYVEFRSDALVGTKCTNDQGSFVSILVNPSADEKATVSKEQTLEGTLYGLSLVSDACTSDTQLLATYQSAFSDAFYLLKKTD